MTIKQFIEKAIEGEWKPNWASFPQITLNSGNEQLMDELEVFHLHKILLDPLAWQAVGKVEGWEDHRCEQCHDVFPEYHNGCVRCGKSVRPDPFMRYHQHRMIDALAEASQKPNFNIQKTIEEFLETTI